MNPLTDSFQRPLIAVEWRTHSNGYESFSTTIKEPYQWWPGIIFTNFAGVVYAVRCSLPLMKRRSRKSNPTSIVLMGSLASMQRCYGYGIYKATKHDLKGLAECRLKVQVEYRRESSGVVITVPQTLPATINHLQQNNDCYIYIYALPIGLSF